MSLPPMAGPGWYPMPPPPPMVNPLEFSSLLGETFRLFRRAGRPLLALGAVNAVVGAGTSLVLVWLYGPQFFTGLTLLSAPVLTTPMLVCAAAGLGVMMVTAQCCAMVVQVTRQVMVGQPADLGAAWRETTTIIPRLVLPYLVLNATILLTTAVGATVFLNSLNSVRSRGDVSAAGATLLGLLAGVLLAGTVAAVVSFWLRVRMFVFVPVASLEKLSGFVPARRSLHLTAGIGGAIFSALLVVAIVEGVAAGLAWQVGSALLPASLAAGNIGGLVNLVSGLLPAVAVVLAVDATVKTLTVPFLTVMSTVVHHHRFLAGPTG